MKERRIRSSWAVGTIWNPVSKREQQLKRQLSWEGEDLTWIPRAQAEKQMWQQVPITMLERKKWGVLRAHCQEAQPTQRALDATEVPCLKNNICQQNSSVGKGPGHQVWPEFDPQDPHGRENDSQTWPCDFLLFVCALTHKLRISYSPAHIYTNKKRNPKISYRHYTPGHSH